MKDKEKNVYQCILAVREEVKAVAAKGYNTFHKYNYKMAKDVVQAVRTSLNKHGLVIIPKGVKDLEFTKGGAVLTAQAEFLLIAPDGSTDTAIVLCAGEDKGDKAAYKANTGALKYLFISMFLLDGGIDAEDATNGQEVKAPKVASKPPAKEGGVLTAGIFKNWNGGKIYGLKGKNPYIFINNAKYTLSTDQVEKVKLHNKYVPSE